MKKLLFLFMAVLLLAACGSGADKEYKDQLKQAQKDLEKAKVDTEKLEDISNQIDATSDLISETQEQMGITEESITNDQARELLEYEALGEGDSLIDINVENGEVKAVIEMVDASSIFAEVIYSSAGDALLEHEGWEVLTIEFIDVGEISMHRNEKETNEYGMDYFPLEKIIGQLRNE